MCHAKKDLRYMNFFPSFKGPATKMTNNRNIYLGRNGGDHKQ